MLSILVWKWRSFVCLSIGDKKKKRKKKEKGKAVGILCFAKMLFVVWTKLIERWVPIENVAVTNDDVTEPSQDDADVERGDGLDGFIA